MRWPQHWTSSSPLALFCPRRTLAYSLSHTFFKVESRSLILSRLQKQQACILTLLAPCLSSTQLPQLPQLPFREMQSRDSWPWLFTMAPAVLALLWNSLQTHSQPLIAQFRHSSPSNQKWILPSLFPPDPLKNTFPKWCAPYPPGTIVIYVVVELT